MARQFQSILSIRTERKQFHAIADILPQLEIDFFQVQLTRFDFGEVKDIINNKSPMTNETFDDPEQKKAAAQIVVRMMFDYGARHGLTAFGQAVDDIRALQKDEVDFDELGINLEGLEKDYEKIGKKLTERKERAAARGYTGQIKGEEVTLGKFSDWFTKG